MADSIAMACGPAAAASPAALTHVIASTIELVVHDVSVAGAHVDGALPLTIQPAPKSLARVFVGRIELLSPATRESITDAVYANDTARLMKFGRFLQPFARQMKMANTAVTNVQNQMLGSFSGSRSCVE